MKKWVEDNIQMNHVTVAKNYDETRILWETVFDQDSQAFVSYYYNEIAKYNIQFVITNGERCESMIHLNPYSASILVGNNREWKEALLHYIVGVATVTNKRKLGYMDAVLRRGLEELYEKQEAFTFLMPAAKEIYEPYGFSFIYERINYRLAKEKENTFHIRVCDELELETVSVFASNCLRRDNQCFLTRTEAYFKRLQKEIKSQNGDLYIVEKNGEWVAYFSYSEEDDFVQELLFVPDYEEELMNHLFYKDEATKPIIMARIVCLETFLELFRSEKAIQMILQVEDTIICQNQGTFLWEISDEKSTVKRYNSAEIKNLSKEIIKIAQEDLLRVLFGRLQDDRFDGIIKLQKVFINEIV